MRAEPTIGHNGPPSAIDAAEMTTIDLRAFAKEHPAITDHAGAKAAASQIERGKRTLKDLDAERRAKVEPLDRQVKAINAEVKAVASPLETAVAAIEATLKAFLRTEEDRRQREAEEAQRIADEAKRAAQAAEAREREAIANAAAGDVDADRVGATIDADSAFTRFEQANRAAARAARDAKVRVSGGHGRAISLRTLEALAITDRAAAVTAMVGDEDLDAAICTAARRFRKEWGELPPGVRSERARG